MSGATTGKRDKESVSDDCNSDDYFEHDHCDMDFLEIYAGDDSDYGNNAHYVRINDRDCEFLLSHYIDLFYLVKCLGLKSLSLSELEVFARSPIVKCPSWIQ